MHKVIKLIHFHMLMNFHFWIKALQKISHVDTIYPDLLFRIFWLDPKSRVLKLETWLLGFEYLTMEWVFHQRNEIHLAQPPFGTNIKGMVAPKVQFPDLLKPNSFWHRQLYMYGVIWFKDSGPWYHSVCF